MEEGEIIDDDVDDLYTPLKRPSEPEPSHRSMEQDSEPSEESESNDSDDSQRGQKKPKLKPALRQSRPLPDKSKKYNIWCSGIQEEVLTQELTNCEVAQRYEKSRDVESYDYTMFHSNEGEDQARNIPPHVSNKRQHGERQNRGIRARLGRRRSSDDSMRGTPRAMLELSVTVENTEEEVAKDIANKLCEQKEELILRSVHVLGKAKAIEIFRSTRKIEEGGGMLVMNQTRRRTPGGVYLFHVKSDSTQEESEQIFTEDRKRFDIQRRLERSRQRREKARAMQRTLEQGNQLALPNSPLGEPLSCEEEEPGGSNPPPSPVTDGRADSSPESCPKPPMPHQIAAAAAATAARQQQQAQTERNLVIYDDFLDLNASFEMDV